jgi:tetraprenyl-beta-curcumene synthase
MVADRPAPSGAFARAALGYWAGVFPAVCRELRHWRARAERIPDPALRRLALEALAKRGNMEGAAAFATFAPRAHRRAVVRATVAFQAAYNHLDVLSEQPGSGRVENARRLHEALLTALACLPPAMGGPREGDPAAPQFGYDERHGPGDDGGYLAAMVDACRAALAELPSYPAVASAARRAAERVVSFQSLHRGYAQGDHEALERWARAETPAGADLRWWETAAAAGSSLGVHVMIAAAAERTVDPARVAVLEHAYFPWIGALHSLLDQLIDTAEDARTAQRNLLGYYGTPREAAERMSRLARRSLEHAGALPPSGRHPLIVAAMASFYLSSPEASEPGAQPVSRAVLEAIGPLASPPMAVFKARRAAERVCRAGRRGAGEEAAGTLALRSAGA